MSLEAKLIFTACVLAVIVPLFVVVLRRMLRGEPFDKTGGPPLPPPSGPSVNIDGGGS